MDVSANKDVSGDQFVVGVDFGTLSARALVVRVSDGAEVGTAVALGVLLDTLVVRSVLVTALNLDLGRWIWWPSRLYRQPSPHTDILNERAATVR